MSRFVLTKDGVVVYDSGAVVGTPMPTPTPTPTPVPPPAGVVPSVVKPLPSRNATHRHDAKLNESVSYIIPVADFPNGLIVGSAEGLNYPSVTMEVSISNAPGDYESYKTMGVNAGRRGTLFPYGAVQGGQSFGLGWCKPGEVVGAPLDPSRPWYYNIRPVDGVPAGAVSETYLSWTPQ